MKLLTQKKIILCSAGKIKYIFLAVWWQYVGIGIGLFFAFWVLQTSIVFFLGNDMLRQKSADLAREKFQNHQLKEEVVYYKSKVENAEKLALSVQESHKEILGKVDSLVSSEIKKKEAVFEKIKAPLKESGINFPELIKNVQPSKNVGGPYIPDETYALLTFHYVQKLTDVYTKVDYLESLVNLEKATPFGAPIKKPEISASFGKRLDPFTKLPARHEGIDLTQSEKAPIYVAASGVVRRAFTNGAYGQFIEIEHKFGFVTRYAHLSEILVKKGDAVKPGDKIGIMGNTGRSTGPHLHYEILLAKRPINPYRFIKMVGE